MPGSDLPPLYARWARELIGDDPPSESRATCLDCAMLQGPDDPPELVYVSPNTKCCTYTPVLPNFLAGAILADASPEAAHGRRTLLARIATREGVTPVGVSRTAAVDALYDALAPTRFGRDDALQCPHLTDDRLCGIWRHRNAVCATWFCKHQHGAIGEQFWTAIREWLRVIERELAVWCVLQAQWPAAALDEVMPPARPKHLPSPPAPAPAGIGGWGAWRGREAEFYVECAARVNGMRWTDVAPLCGASVVARAAMVKEAFRRQQSTAVPEHLVAAPVMLLRRDGESATVVSYRGSDPLALSEDAQRVVARFDGDPTSEVLARLREEDGLDVEPELLRILYEFKVLQPPRTT